MRPFVLAELRARRRMVAGLAASAFVYLLVLGLSYRAFGVEGLGQAFGNDAPRALTAFGGSRDADILSPDGWMGLGFNHPMLMLTSLTAALVIGTGAIAGEVDSGRGQLLFSAPVARTRFLSAALLTWLVAEVVILLAALAGAVAGAELSPDLRAAGVGGLAWAPLQLLPLTLLVAAIGLAASVLSDTRGRALGIAIGVTVLAYLLNVISGLTATLDWLRWCTPFGYYQPGDAITHGPQPGPAMALIAAATVLLALSRRALERRDLA